MLAMVVNDNACELDERGALESIASRLTPTVSRQSVMNLFKGRAHATADAAAERDYRVAAA
ncbi:hypothetical protein [Pseudomonas baetica]|uniref:hypothetical protein n=1 Tax=Pseudomonas baetica TaxID=674054 RepID=UPI00240647A4|nr:hypothetical protein [Pseudomonas baetica]MDF9773807.1 hypothetical protein [Pseudomonas baetica]